MQIFPLLCITNGTSDAMYGILFVPVFCHFSEALYLSTIIGGLQEISMGYDRSQVHSNKGDSQNLFIFMCGFGGLLMVVLVVSK